MVIEVRLDLTLQKYISTNSYGMLMVDVQDGIVLSELLDEMEINFKAVRFATVNGAGSDFNRVLVDGDKIGLFS